MVENDLVVLNPMGDGNVVIDQKASSVFETLTIKGADRTVEENLYLGCLACNNLVKIFDDLDGTYVSKLGD